jgi:uncharacterized protein (TIGR02145 family)
MDKNFIRIASVCFIVFLLSLESMAGEKIDARTATEFAQKQVSKLQYQKNIDYQNVDFSDMQVLTEGADTLMYVFNLKNNEGWIILSAEKKSFPLVGWSPEGSFGEYSQLPATIQSFLKKQGDHILAIRKGVLPATLGAEKAWQEITQPPTKLNDDDEVIVFEPLMDVLWNQGCGYNSWCPPDASGPCGHAWVGCVAAAQGQIMKYWNYPAQGRGSHNYTSQYGELSVDFSQQNYNWDAMPENSYNDEVAKLLYHVGVSVEMNYAPDESVALSEKVRNSLTRYFGYSFRAKYHTINNYAESKVVELITSELTEGRVVYYGGCPDVITNNNPCHAFVIDGFMSYAGYHIFHFNFGWGGTANGYFYIQDLIGSGMNFSNPTELITGIVPSGCPAFDLPYSENFESESADCWQSFNNGSKAFNWEEAINQNRTPGGRKSAKHAFWAMSNQPEDSYLLSPAINLPANPTSPIELSFWSKNNCPDLYSNGKNSVLVSVDGGNSFAQIWAADQVFNDWSKTIINLDAFAGQTIQIAFRYEKNNGPDAHTWFVDDISVKIAEPTPPEVGTLSVFNITAGSATVVGQISEAGDSPVNAKGVVWSTSAGPTLENHTGMASSDHSSDIFHMEISGLSNQTTYYVRAWATNDQGTGYGNEIVFTAQTSPFVCGESTITDVEGNVYSTVAIGNQCWLGENLKTTRYRNTIEINNPNCIVNFMNNEWGMDDEGAYLSWNNDEQFREKYGAIYNLHAAQNENKLCPAGWHVPHDFEWMLLERNLGMTADVASTMGWRGNDEGSKLAGYRDLWAFDALRMEPAFGTSGFDATPSGWYPFPTFGQENTDPETETAWWTSSPYQGGNISRRISYDQSGIERSTRTASQGHYVRCIRNLPYLNTLGVNEVTYTSANTGGWVNVYFDDVESEILNKGLVWSTNPNPNLENNLGMIEFGGGTDNFYHTLENLMPHTAYYIKAFAENSLGITYGNEVKFYTLGPVMPCPDEETVTDADGNTYTTVRLGDQCWIAQNLRTTVNNLGEPMERLCHSDNNEQCTTLGGLYRWNTLLSGESAGNATDEMVQGICPTEWYLPKNQEWEQLNNYLVNHGYNYDHTLENNLTAKSLASSELWYNFANPPTGSPGNEPDKNNTTGFTAIPAGAYRANQTYIPVGESANFWSLSESVSDNNTASYRQLEFRTKGLETDSISKEAAMSVRCFKPLNTTSIPSKMIKDNQLIIYPNPGTGVFSIEIPDRTTAKTIDVFDTSGRLILQKRLDETSHTHQIDLSKHPAGLYHVRVVQEKQDKLWQGRWVKTR